VIQSLAVSFSLCQLLASPHFKIDVPIPERERKRTYGYEGQQFGLSSRRRNSPKFACEGADVSPPLQWNGVPAGATSLALICDDPDAPARTWVHRVLYSLPITVSDLPENVPASKTLSSGDKKGINDSRRAGYGGPCLPAESYRRIAIIEVMGRHSERDSIADLDGRSLKRGSSESAVRSKSYQDERCFSR
jgi:Raf kinase inhibitor-like YbhB/YbcL family protein